MSTLENESLPIDPSLYGNCALAYDLAYSQADTQFMIDAKNNGAQSVSDGWGMLVEQGAASFEIGQENFQRPIICGFALVFHILLK